MVSPAKIKLELNIIIDTWTVVYWVFNLYYHCVGEGNFTWHLSYEIVKH